MSLIVIYPVSCTYLGQSGFSTLRTVLMSHGNSKANLIRIADNAKSMTRAWRDASFFLAEPVSE
ncbi:uncharacterized protein FOMMEDRAFT_154086 [Fomitiporia mediterranea MF3/22]|uniref:uncharacterized protein n=1 Tax=Fomitiporia mediterranea (strain MF3/22) TaxID=694068 RepID=UPI00044093A6|nr:uncharacterized protein FOMMEDRAFT_154086 [Fomitiporia mediterranea MF3/22]EJD04937.1 hypothetical protein FOMMEDRAFT_154086 [Fomitiporia mediterranea MF3/22]